MLAVEKTHVGIRSAPPAAAANAAPLVIERYELTGLLGKGGFGEVWLAHDRQLDREVAIKLVHRKWTGEAAFSEQFRHEAIITGQLQHPGIVPVYELGRTMDGRLYYAMKFVHGKTLHEEIPHFQYMPAGLERDEKRRHLYQTISAVARILAYAHTRQVLHLDLKPGNIILGEFGETQVLDWGLATLLGGQHEHASPRSIFGVCGTPGYMAPEQLVDHPDAFSPATDLYALGVILAEIALAEQRQALPVVDRTSLADAQQVIEPAIRRLRGPLGAICRKATAGEPAQRYQDAREFAAEIERFLAGERVFAYREGIVARLRRAGRKRKPLVTAVLVGLLAALGWAADRYYRWESLHALAEHATREAINDWQQGRARESRQHLRAAVDALTDEPFARTERAGLIDWDRSLRDWQAFDALLGAARSYSLDPDRRADAVRVAEQARTLAATRLPVVFQSETVEQPRAEAVAELQQLLHQLRPERYPATPSLPVHAAFGWYSLGREQQLGGHWADAVQSYGNCLALRPDHFWAMVFQAAANHQLGKFAEAIVGYTAALARRPELPFLYLNRGNAYLDLGQTEFAWRDYEQARELGSDDPKLSYNRARLLLQQGRTAEARVECEAALAEQRPGPAVSRLLHAEILMEQGDLASARAELDAHLRGQPRDPRALIDRAIIACARNERAQAAADLDAAGSVDAHHPRLAPARGLYAALRRDWLAAATWYEAALATDPSNPRLHYNLADAWREQGQLNRAKEALDRAILLKPDYVQARLGRALVMVQRGDPKAALGDVVEIPASVADRDAIRLAECYGSMVTEARRNQRIDRGDAQALVEHCQACLRHLAASRGPQFQTQLAQNARLRALLNGSPGDQLANGRPAQP